jgi:ribosomal protein S18
MTISDFYINTEDLAKLKDANISSLQKLMKEYPYFQAIHLLLLLAMKLQNNPQFDKQLAFSSVYVPNRDLLYNLLNKKYFEKEVQPTQSDNHKPAAEVEKEEQKETDIKKDLPSKESDSKLLKNKNVRRKIKDSLEGMGENISETLLSQIEFSEVKDGEELQYPPEIYFIDDERTGKNNVITIDARPGKISESQKKDIFQIDESEEISEVEHKSTDKKTKATNENRTKSKTKGDNNGSDLKIGKVKNFEYFDINNYAEGDIIENADDNDLIARFIAEKPRIKPKEITDQSEDISRESTKEDDDLLTETLIKVYIAQGYIEKAITSYEKLSLKYPEKSTYFANQIKKLKEQLNK